MLLTTRVVLAFCSFVTAAAISAEPPQTAETAGERYKSVQVLNAIPSAQVIPTMAAIANSLGVTCGHCHTNDFASDAKPAKQRARDMIRMTQAINRDHYAGQMVVTCQTCHDGRAIPASVPTVDDAGWAHPAPAPDPQLPSADTVIAAYVRGLGGEPALQRLKSRRVIGTVTRFDGRTEPVSAPFQLYQDSHGTAELSTDLSFPPEASAEIAAAFVRPPNLARAYQQRLTSAAERIRGRDVLVLTGTNQRGAQHTLYFDRESGLLLRRTDQSPTAVGPLPQRYEFENYRAVDGVMVPHTMRWERGDYQVSFQFDTVSHNVPEPRK